MPKTTVKTIFVVKIILLLIAGCQSSPPSETHTAYAVARKGLVTDIKNNEIIDGKKLKNKSNFINDALLKSGRFGQKKLQSASSRQKTFELTAKNTPAHDFFMGLASGSQYSMVVSPDVTGNITLSLKNVSIDDVLNTVERIYGYQYYKSKNGYEILPNKLDTRIFSVNYLDMERTGTSSVEMTTSGISSSNFLGRGGLGVNGLFNRNVSSNNNLLFPQGGLNATSSQVETKSIINFWGKLEDTLVAMLGNQDGRKVVVNPQSGVIVVKGYPKELRIVAEYLDQVQNHMSRQVIIEAKIIEVILSDSYQLGIDWKLFEENLNVANGITGTNSDAYQFLAKFVSDDFETNIKALAKQGTVQVLSSPKVSTVNNQKAVIKVGSDEFFVTDIASGTFNNITSVSSPASNVDLTPFFSGITLDVTPYVDKDDNITIHVHPAVSDVVEQEKNINLGTSVGEVIVPLAKSSVRETDTVIRSSNGQVVVLAGLMQDRTDESISKLPFIGDIPYLGKAFRKTEQTTKKTELVILLKASVVKPNDWTRELNKTTRRFDRLDKGFHLGNRPDLYGTQAEKSVGNWPVDKELIRKIIN